VAIRRISITRFGRSALIGRGFDYLSFYSSAFRSVLALAKPGDVVVAKTDPALLSVAAMQAARRRGLRLVNWLQDLYPEVTVALGVPFIKSPLGLARVFLQLRDASLRAADVNVVVGERMAEVIRKRGIAREGIRVIPNWCDDEEIRPIAPLDNRLRHEWGLGDRFVVGYSGNLGRGHEFETVVHAAERLRGDHRLCLHLVGGGNNLADLTHAVRKRGLNHLFCFPPHREGGVLKLSLGVADVHLISLIPELEGLMVPSKLYGIAAAGRPTIAVTARDGEVARLVQRNDCGLSSSPARASSSPTRRAAIAQIPADLPKWGIAPRHARCLLHTPARVQALAEPDRANTAQSNPVSG
jgi:glycosyltransferase involved in cell wall biosynthesis